MNNNLIFDLGMHKGEDTLYYLKKGYSVIALEADSTLVEKNQEDFKEYIQSGKLKILNNAIYEADDVEIEFNISNLSFWNSIDSKISNRFGNLGDTIKVKTKKLSTLVKEYGVPYYIKIDLEGFDYACMKTLLDIDSRPEFISCETECIGDDEVITDEKALETLFMLKELGYNKFNLVDQKSLEVLQPNELFYGRTVKESFWVEPLRKILFRLDYKINNYTHHELVSIKHSFRFKNGSTGPFGNDLSDTWYDYETAKNMLLFHRKSFYNHAKRTKGFGFWCDWHATT